MDAVTLALGHIKASGGTEFVRADFEAALATGHVRGRVRLAVEAHLFEADPAELAALVAAGFTSFVTLGVLVQKILPATHPNRTYLETAACGSTAEAVATT